MILKSRKPGLSTVCIAYCGYVLRFRDRNARVHLFSRTERSALDLFAAVKFGLDSLPKWMQLPKERETLKQLEYVAGADDRRELVSYPTSDATTVAPPGSPTTGLSGFLKSGEGLSSTGTSGRSSSAIDLPAISRSSWRHRFAGGGHVRGRRRRGWFRFGRRSPGNLRGPLSRGLCGR